jgi:hypothetical protein
VAFQLTWNDDPECTDPPGSRSISNRGWWLILDEIVAQRAGDLTEPPRPPRPPILERLWRRAPPPPQPWDIDVDPDDCTYPINLFPLEIHGTSVVSERACQALLQRLSREPTLDWDATYWPEGWEWFYDYLRGAAEHGGFDVG